MASPNPFKSSSASSPRHVNGVGGNGNNGGGNSTASSVRRSFTFTSSTKSSKNTNHQPPFTPCSSPIFLPERVPRQNEDSENIRPKSGVKSPTPLPKGVKGFMAPTLSAVFKANSPKKKVLSEKNEGGFYVSGSPFSLRNSLTKPPKTLMEEEGHDHMEFDSTVKTVSVEDWKIPGKKNYNITTRSDSSDSESVGNLSKYPDPIDEPIQIPPYDPKTNYLSPRPKFLRYKPAKELLKSKETLNDLSGLKHSKQDEEESSCMSEVTNNTKEDHTATSKIEESALQENVIQECENKIENGSFDPRVGNEKEGEDTVKSKVDNLGKAEGDTLEEEEVVLVEEEEEEDEEEEEEEGSFWSIKKILICVFVLLSGATAFHFYGDSVGLSACRYKDVLSRAKLEYLWKSDVADFVPDNQQAPMSFIMENNGHEESIFAGSEPGMDSYEEKEVAFIPEVKEEVDFTDQAKKEETAFPDEVKQEATALTDKVEEETDKSNMQETVAEGDDYDRAVEGNESHNVKKSVDEGEGTILEEDTVQTIIAEGKVRVVEEEGVEEKGRREEEFRNVDNSMFADGVPSVDSSGESICEEGVVESVKEVEGVFEEPAEGFVQSETESVVEAGEAFVSSKVESIVESADAFVKSMDDSVVESADTFVKSIDGSVVEFADTFAKSVGESVVEPEDAFAKSMDENVVESEDAFAKSMDENLESEDSFTKLMDENVANSQDSLTKPMDESFVDTFVHSVERRDGETSDEESYVEKGVNAKFEDLFTFPSEQVSQGFAYSKSPEVEEGHEKEVKFSDSGIEDHEAESEIAPVKIFSDIKEEIDMSMADSTKVTYDQQEDSSEIISQDVISITELQNADIPEVVNEEELGGREDSSSIFEGGLFSKTSFAAISALAIATMAILWKLFRFSSNDAEQSSRKVEFLGSSSPLTEETIENAVENAYVTQNAYDTRNTYATTANHHIRNSSISPPKVHLLSEYLPEEVNSTDRFRSRRGNTVSWATQSHRTPQTTAQSHQVPQTTTSTVSDFTETSSYGSFTTFDKIHLKEAEKITPVRRSSRIRQQKGVTSPVQS